nr:class I SAM-dependent methyltransferase [Sphingomonas sp. G-3-2-10]
MTAPSERLSGIRTRMGAAPLPANARLLVAGCGTGREAQRLAMSAPEASVTGIDLSSASLAWARAHCDAPNLTLERRDLHTAPEIGPFDHIASSGVLHHLPDPESGWAALTEALAPGGTMRIMLYSRIARLQVQAARRLIADLIDRPVTADLIRQVRARIIAADFQPIIDSVSFYSMGGIHDLLLHRHEDPFDLPRIGRALDRFGLELLGFSLPGREATAAYRAAHSGDPAVRDLAALHAWERGHPRLFNGMYDFWCTRRT